MKLAYCYTVFDGLELLEQSIKAHDSQVDLFIICWQEFSHKGKLNKDVEKIVNAISGAKIHKVKFTPKRKDPKENEIDKHNLMIETARALGATHFILSATDHFYHWNEISYAKEIVLKENYEVTFTAMYTYYKNPTWRIEPKEKYYMPFICKLIKQTSIRSVHNYPIYIDPSIQIMPCNRWILFNEDEVILHHYSYVRNNILEKLENGAYHISFIKIMDELKKSFKNYELGQPLVHLKGHTTIEVPNYFDIVL